MGLVKITYIWLKFMVNAGKYTIHGSYRLLQPSIETSMFLEANQKKQVAQVYEFIKQMEEPGKQPLRR